MKEKEDDNNRWFLIVASRTHSPAFIFNLRNYQYEIINNYQLYFYYSLNCYLSCNNIIVLLQFKVVFIINLKSYIIGRSHTTSLYLNFLLIHCMQYKITQHFKQPYKLKYSTASSRHIARSQAEKARTQRMQTHPLGQWIRVEMQQTTIHLCPRAMP